MDDADEPRELGHPEVFRGPTPREHRIAAGLFVGFAVFFGLLFIVLAGWWFRWVIAGLAVYSFLHGIRHWREAREAREARELGESGEVRETREARDADRR